jgi:uncharacterized protein (DUF983 family)
MNDILRIALHRCPKCGKSHMFHNKNPYNLKDLFKMKDRCSSCGQLFELETGFYYGAMYISYALTIGIYVPFVLIMEMYFKLNLLLTVGLLILLAAGIAPYLFRTSRALWLYVFVKKRKNAD